MASDFEPSGGRVTTVDKQRGTDDEGRLVGDEEEGGLGHFPGGPHPADWRPGVVLLLGPGGIRGRLDLAGVISCSSAETATATVAYGGT